MGTATHDVSQLDDEQIEEAIPRRISSLRDVQVLYGALYALAEHGTVAGAGVTPDEGDSFLGHDSILAIDIDLTGSEPTLADPPVSVHHYNSKKKPLLAHARYIEGRNAVDHSVTHQTGANLDTVPKWTAKRLSTWPFEDGIADLAVSSEDGEEADPDGWVIAKLQQLGRETDEGEDSSAVEQIKSTVANLDLDTRGAMATVRLRLSEEDLDSLDRVNLEGGGDDEWHWPGEFEVFSRAMQARREDKFASKGGGDASGSGACFVFGSEGEEPHDLYGSISDPIGNAGLYQTNTVEKFPNLDVNEAWRSFGLSFHAASMMSESDTFVEACRYRNWRGKSRNEYRFWTLPYLTGDLTADDARWLYELLDAQTDEATEYERLRNLAFDDDSEVEWSDVPTVTPIDRIWEHVVSDDGTVDDDLLDRLRLHVIGARVVDNGNLNVVLDEPSGAVLHAVALAEAHETILDKIATFGEESEVNEWEPFPLFARWDLLDLPTFHQSRIRFAATPVYFFRTCASVDDEVAVDPRYVASTSVLAGRPIAASQLLEQYAERIRTEFDPESKYPMPTGVIAEQYVQLCALAEADLLGGDGEITNMIDDSDTADRTEWYQNEAPNDRERAVDSFLEGSPPLNPNAASSDRETVLAHERRTMFLLGALVEKVSAYQVGVEGLEKTLAHSVERRGITRRHINKIINDVYHYDTVYSGKEGRPLYWQDLLRRLTASYSQISEPEEWSLNADEIETWYAFGHVFGGSLPSNGSSSEETEEVEMMEEPITAADEEGQQ